MTRLAWLIVAMPLGVAFTQELHVSRVEDIRFASGTFNIAGNLYLPSDTANKSGLIIWIHGSGPDLRTGRFPGAEFFNCFLDNGFAFFRHDRPGDGDSKGEFTDSLLFRQRAGIVCDAIDALKKHPQIDFGKIGLVGSSQAGYVIPFVLAGRSDVAFLVGLSLPAQNGHEQWAYLLKMQLQNEGYRNAEEWSRMHLKLIRSPNYPEFLRNVDYFKRHPIHIPSLKGYDSTFAESLHEWWPLDWAKPQSFDPMTLMTDVKIPALILYGDKDTQVDPVQGADAYRKALRTADNPFYLVKTIPNADHNLAFAVTGSLKEQQSRKQYKLAPGVVDIVAEWVRELKLRLSTEEKDHH
jgi:hypothetical protein